LEINTKFFKKKKQIDHQLTFFDQSNHTRSERKILLSIFGADF